MAGTAGRTGLSKKPKVKIDKTVTDGAPDAPDGRSDAFYGYWTFLVAHLPADCLRKVDALQLAILCEQLREIDQLSAIIDADPSDLKARSLRLRIAQQVSRLSAQFGLSPSDRMRLQLEPQQDEDDPFSELLARIRN